MAELKNTFTGGKMNKDFDHRLVPNGEYRDAINIQVKTTDSIVGYGESDSYGDMGAIQNLKGTKLIKELTESGSTTGFGPSANLPTRCVASVADEKNNKAYFFFTNGPIYASNINNARFIDSIVEYNLNTNTCDPVVVDVFGIQQTQDQAILDANLPDGSEAWNTLTFIDASPYRAGMKVQILGSTNPVNAILRIESVNTTTNVVTFSTTQDTHLSSATAFKFSADRVLNFSSYSDGYHLMSGINVIDNYIYWTDGVSEPKRINIDKCKHGTSDYISHTKLSVRNPDTYSGNEYISLSNVEFNSVDDQLKEEHVTVIRRAPTTPPTIEIKETYESSPIVSVNSNSGNNNTFVVEIGGDTVSVGVGETCILQSSQYVYTFYKANEVLNFTAPGNPSVFVRTRFISYLDSDDNEVLTTTSRIKVLVLDKQGAITVNDGSWDVEVVVSEKDKSLFELEFVRFGYRYIYDDGEYSSFSPFSDTVFEPRVYKYETKHGYNLGMVNNIVEITVKNFIPFYMNRPLDVSGVEILLKRSDSPVIYVVKKIQRGIDPEWDQFTATNSPTTFEKNGELTITSDMIHIIVESNQILRSYDNVPRRALAQEIVANRLVYGNYVENYDLNYPVSLIQSLNSNSSPSPTIPQRSVKSGRNYKWGVVFGDKYGRETPVLSSSYLFKYDSTTFSALTGDVVVDKSLCASQNSFTIKQNWTSESGTNSQPLDWMDYVKYYVKETSSEYYNLVMDKWYYAEEQKNLWLSFASSDRNKVDEETYLVLKSKHGQPEPVLEPNRYRIIAIENEAPDFVKTDRRQLARIEMVDSNLFTDTSSMNTYDSTPNNLFPGVGANNVSITFGNDQWGNILGSYEKRGELRFRIVADVVTNTGVITHTLTNHDYQTIGLFAEQGDNAASGCFLRWTEPLKQGVIDYFTHASNLGITLAASGNNLKYYFEIIEDVVENKPEFDGRFFVLIERDNNNIISQNVEIISAAKFGYVVQEEYQIGYISSSIKNPATIGAYNNYTFNTGDGATYLPNTNFGTAASEGDPDDFTGSDKDPNLMSIGCNGGSNDYGSDSINLADDTKDFWADLRNNQVTAASATGGSSEYAGVFIDEARSRAWQWTTDPSGYAAEFYKPDGLDQGGANSGTRGRMVLSQQVANPDDISGLGWQPGGSGGGSDGQGEDFYDKIAVGTKFRFKQDPENIYVIIDTDPLTGNSTPIKRAKSVNYNTLDTGWFGITSANSLSDIGVSSDTTTGIIGVGCDICIPSNSTGGARCARHSVQFEFRKLVDGEITGDGIPNNSFDPRGEMRHDGTSVIIIQIMSQLIDPGSIVVPEDDRAVWETEPKENIDLELYFEASPAIPIKLNSFNSYAFMPPKSIISESRDGYTPPSVLAVANASPVLSNNEVIFTDIDTNSPFNVITAKGTYVHLVKPDLSNDGVVVHIKSLGAGGSPFYQKDDIGVGDLIGFKHGDGTITKSKVLNRMNLSGDVSDTKTKYQRRIKKNADGTSFTIERYNRDAVPNASWTTTGATSNMTSGFQILPDTATYTSVAAANTADIGVDDAQEGVYAGGIPLGCFIFNYYGESDNMTTTLGVDWMADDYYYYVEIQGSDGVYLLDDEVWKYETDLSWYNCYSFGNGVESDRIRDDYNAPQIGNGVSVSTTVSNYGEENKTNSLIYSGIYNSGSKTNNLNEFNMAEKITKNINPSYGSIQALKTRDSDLVVLAEDKILKVLASKDALYNADGNPQLTATDKVLGTAIPFAGDYGISRDPRSLASDQYRLYFTDRQRGAVLRLSRDGLTPISSVGMSTWFKDNLPGAGPILGSFDKHLGEYNVTFDIDLETEVSSESVYSLGNIKTVAWNEVSKGWVSFRSFGPDSACSIANTYLAGVYNKIYRHNDANVDRNSFYGGQYFSSLKLVFNEPTESVKLFKTLGYEGSQARVDKFNIEEVTDDLGNKFFPTDGEYYNKFNDKTGWYVDSFITDLDSAQISEFKNKENKWFNKLEGSEYGDSIDTDDFNVQGLGVLISKAQTVILDGDGNQSGGDDDDGDNIDNGNGTDGNTSEGDLTLTIQNDPND